MSTSLSAPTKAYEAQTVINFLVAMFAAFALLLPGLGYAWGAQGHRMIGLIAQEHLSPQAKAGVRQLTGGESLAAQATWMDDVRNTPEGKRMQRWHYINDDLPSCQSPAARIVGKVLHGSCVHGECAMAQVRRAVSTLRLIAQGPVDAGGADGRVALRILVHLVADLHQPLHAANNGDSGGNATLLTNRRCGESAGKGCSLHAYWDTDLVKKLTRGMGEERTALWLATSPTPAAADVLQPERWAAESNGIADTVVYALDGRQCGAPSRLEATDEYDRVGVVVVRDRMVLAGMRLAGVLNAVFRK